MYLLFIIAVVFAIFLNTNIGEAIGLTHKTAVSFLPMMVYIALTLLTQKMRYNKIAIYLLILAVIILLLKWSIGQDYIVIIGQLLVIPMLMFICFDRLTRRQSSTLRRLMLLFFIVFCALAIVEKAFNYHFFPLAVETEKHDLSIGVFRSYSFFEHHLISSYFVTIFMSFVSIAHFQKKYSQIFLFFLGYIALFCFDGRGAIIIVTLILLPYFLWKLHKTVEKKRWMFNLGVICMLFGLVYLISETSLGNGRLTNANARLMDSSAETRLDVFNFYKYYNKHDDFIWGRSDNSLDMAGKLGAAGVENSIIEFIMLYGIIFAPILLLLLFLLQYKSLSVYKKHDKLVILLTFWGLGNMSPLLAAPIIWILWIFTYYSFKPDILR